MRRRFISLLWLSTLSTLGVLAAACTTPVGSGSRPTGTAIAGPQGPKSSRQTSAPVAGASPSGPASSQPVIGGVLPVGPGVGILANGGNNIVSHHGAGVVTTTIAGLVTAPATVIGNNGGSVVSAGGGHYRVMQAGDVPYGGAKVYLLDASAKQVLGTNGQPAYAVTDAQGRYGFTGALPEASHYLLAVQLPGEKGQLGAIAPAGASRQADVSLVSTLTTGYILSQYVRGQPDAQATLDKLPAKVEADTRLKAAAAFYGGATAVPDSLTSEQVVSLVTELRSKDAGFDQQMEDVKRLLVAAGQLNLGEGQPARAVALPLVRGILATADGGILINCSMIGRIFRVDANGRLTTAAGSTGVVETGSLTGLDAQKAGLMALTGMLLDAEGRLLVLEQRRLSRKETNGTLTELWPASTETLVAVGRGPGTDLYVVSAVGLYQLTAAGVKTLKHTFTPDEAAFVKRVVTFGQDAVGRIYLYTGPAAGAPAGEVRRLTPGTADLSAWVAPDTADVRGLALDADGRAYLEGQDGAMRLMATSGAVTPLRGASLGLKAVRNSLTIAADGKLYWAYFSQVYRVEANARVRVAGTEGAAVDADGRVALNGPSGLAVDAGGALLISVFSGHQVLRVQDQEISTFAGNGALTAAGDGGPAVTAAIPLPTALRWDGQGNLYVLQGGLALRKIAPDGTVSTVKSVSTDRRIYDFAVSKDGKTITVTGVTVDALKKVTSGYVEQATGEVTTPVYTGVVGQPVMLHVIALDSGDRLHLMGGGTLRRWADGAFSELEADASLTASLNWSGLARATFDARGRFYYFTGKSAMQLNRYDAASGGVTVVAGPGTGVLAGEGVDDSISNGMSPVFNAAGDLYFCDRSHNQIKKLPAASL